MTDKPESLVARLRQRSDALRPVAPQVQGRVTRLVGLTVEACGCEFPLGQQCVIVQGSGERVPAEVVGFAGEKLYLMPAGQTAGLRPGARVLAADDANLVPVGMGLLGRVIDGGGRPLDDLGPLAAEDWVSLQAPVINPLHRHPIHEPLNVGIRAINALFSVGRGQRLGLFAGSGVGKSVLLGMMARYTSADVTVVGMVGERGREVKEFIEHVLGDQGLQRSVVVASPADESPLMRLRAAQVATRLAEYFRDQGKNVLLLMDSLTRFAQAQREIALSVGEPPATKGYPPSVFAKIPQLVERAGNAQHGGGSVTAFYTVLAEGDDLQDPVADAARAILDGHIALSRRLAEEGHYPAIDVETSISRAMPQVVAARHLEAAQRFRQVYARYAQSRDLIQVGAYVAGSDPETDYAIARMPEFRRFLQQGMNEAVSFEGACEQLDAVLAPPSQPPAAQAGGPLAPRQARE